MVHCGLLVAILPAPRRAPGADGRRPVGKLGRQHGDVAAQPVTVPRDQDVEDMARALIGRVRGTGAGAVLLDVEVDGTRYQLTRCESSLPAAPQADGLSPRELEIARMVALGHANKTIARVLEISSWTVNTHLRRIFGKLGVTTRAAMVARLFHAGGGFGLPGVVEPELDLRA
jgi:DNA-binding CsgD family transcriptional regulator